MSATTDRIENTIRVHLPGALPAAIRLEMFLAVEELCRDALQIPPATDSASLPETWLTDANWQLHQRLIIDGTLARLQAQPEKPYSNSALAAVHMGFWADGLKAARTVAATTPVPANGYGRILANLRSHFPAARDPALLQELFNAADEFTRAILQTTPPNSTASPETWLSAELYDQHFRLLMAGASSRLLIQPGKPWSDPKLAAVQAGIWETLIVQARADFEARAVADPWQPLMENLRVQLPGSKDSQILQELFNTIDEACRTVLLWTETAPLDIILRQSPYHIDRPGAEIVGVTTVSHPTLSLADMLYDEDSQTLDLGKGPDERDVLSPVFVTLRLAPLRAPTPDAYLPGNLWTKHHQLLLDGTLGRMMAQAAKPYSSPKLAEYHLRRFRNAMQTVRFRTTGCGTAWRFPASTTRRTLR